MTGTLPEHIADAARHEAVSQLLRADVSAEQALAEFKATVRRLHEAVQRASTAARMFGGALGQSTTLVRPGVESLFTPFRRLSPGRKALMSSTALDRVLLWS